MVELKVNWQKKEALSAGRICFLLTGFWCWGLCGGLLWLWRALLALNADGCFELSI